MEKIVKELEKVSNETSRRTFVLSLTGGKWSSYIMATKHKILTDTLPQTLLETKEYILTNREENDSKKNDKPFKIKM